MHVVGWEQSYNPATAIYETLTESESGLTFQGAHPLVTLDNIKSVMPDNFGYIYPDWTNDYTYAKGDKVKHNNRYWVAKQNNIAEEPGNGNDYNDDFNNDFTFDDETQYWKPYNLLSNYLEHLTVNGINQMVQKFIEHKQLNREMKSLMERRTFFDGAARLAATIQSKGRLVGFEIVPVRSMGVTAKIERIGLQMVGATGEITMYLFHSSQVAPMRTVTLNFTNTNGGFQWFVPTEPIYLPYISNGNDSGGAWFLCYNQNDMPEGMEALNVSKDWSREPCQTCLGGSIESWRELTKYLQVSPFAVHVPEDFKDYPEMFDIGEIAYTNTMNYGMNCEISVGCDLTDFIISQRAIFANVLQKQVAANVLRLLAMNPDVRVNRNQSNVSRMDILYELDGNTNGQRPGGLGYELKRSYDALELDTRGLDRICMSCNNHGVKYRTV